MNLALACLAAAAALSAAGVGATEMAHLLTVSDGASFDGAARAKPLAELETPPPPPPVAAPSGSPPAPSGEKVGNRIFYGIFAVQMTSSFLSLGLGLGGLAGGIAFVAGIIMVLALVGCWF